MPRLVISLDGVVLRETRLVKDRTTIGRRAQNDIVVDHLAVSGEHAVVYELGTSVYLEDLGSTNGTTVNGLSIKRHLLRSGDTIEIGKYRLEYLAEGATPAEGEADVDAASPWQLRRQKTGFATIQLVGSGSAPDAPSNAVLRITSGVNQGRELPLVKALTTIGCPGNQVAVITRRPTGYFMAHIEGVVAPSVNGVDIGLTMHPLKDGDTVELAGVKMEFVNPPAQ